MKTVLGLSGGGWNFLAGYLVPAAIAISLFRLGVLPNVSWRLVDRLFALSVGEQSIFLASIAIGLGFVLYALQMQLHRVLEGYYLPPRIRKARVSKQRAKREVFIARHGAEGQEKGIEAAIALERRGRWPAIAGETAPTRYGNAIRSFEVYGVARFRLDAMSLWYELEAVAPEHLRAELDRARSPVDFCVNALYLSGLYGSLSILTAFTQHHDRLALILGGAAALVLVPFWYWTAIASMSEWREVVQAMVNTGRPRLAEVFGLKMPPTFREERRMWRSISRIAQGRHTDEDFTTLDTFRVPLDQQPENKEDSAA